MKTFKCDSQALPIVLDGKCFRPRGGRTSGGPGAEDTKNVVNMLVVENREVVLLQRSNAQPLRNWD